MDPRHEEPGKAERLCRREFTAVRVVIMARGFGLMLYLIRLTR
jgi:hypothetical protein